MIAILAGVLYGALELRQFRHTQEREATFELMRTIQTPEFAASLTTLLRVPEGRHGPNFQFRIGDARLPDEPGEAVRWFDAHLKEPR